VAGVRPDQLDASTPCHEWDLRQLLAHTIGVIVNIGRGAAGEDLLPDLNALPLDTDVATQFRVEADRTLAAWSTRGLDGEIEIGAGPMPAMIGITINVLDTATHSWDIARATGQDGTLPEELATDILAMSRGFITDAVRNPAAFHAAVPVPADAGPTDQLVAFLGRQP
jgi:uncharacterized protein (TIGR03086 family)